MNAIAVIVGDDSANTLGVVEALGRKSVRPYVIIYGKLKRSFVLASKYVHEAWICDSEEKVISCILDNIQPLHCRVALIATSDNLAVLLDKNFDRFTDNIVIPTIRRQGDLEGWMEKERMVRAAEQIGIDVPLSWVITDKKIPSEMVYPCVTKPTTSYRKGKYGYSKCYSREELQKYLNAARDGEPVHIQQYIDKDFEFQFIGCSFKGGEDVLIPGYTHIDTTIAYNNLVFLKYDVLEDEYNAICEKSKEFVRMTGYSGLFSIEYMRGKDGRDYFLEMNFRNDGNAISVTDAGINLPFIWYMYASGEDYQSVIQESEVKTTYMLPEIDFFIYMLRGDIPFKLWLDDVRKANSYLIWHSDDPRPFGILLFSSIGRISLYTIKLFARTILKALHLR